MSLKYEPASEPLDIPSQPAVCNRMVVKWSVWSADRGVNAQKLTVSKVDNADNETIWGQRSGAPRVQIEATYRGTSLIRNSAPLGTYSRTVPRALWWS